MARYSEQEKLDLRRIAITEILARLGKRTDHDRHNMYYSPFRDENTPSFHINDQINAWYDFGTNEGGGVIELVCRLLGCSRQEAYDYLAGIGGPIVPEAYIQESKEKALKKRAVSILKADKHFRRALLAYAAQRGISAALLQRYCRDDTYSVEGASGKAFYAIGFRNNEGGYVLRNRDYKVCSSSDITTLSPDGSPTVVPSSDTVLVFEGFLDFLSYMELTGQEEPGYDICVLNSVANINRATDWLYAHIHNC